MPYLVNSFNRGLQCFLEYLPLVDLLDVGCGFGYFMNMAREAGYNVNGVEASKTLTAEGKLVTILTYNLELYKTPISIVICLT